jgi:SagB-type dehydrogenase family enzyme
MSTMDIQAPTSPAASAHRTDPVRDYHLRTAHRFEGFARGPEALDWDAQPAPFRHYSGCETVELPRIDQIPATDALQAALCLPFDQLDAAVPAQALSVDAIGVLLQLSFGLTAWKSFGPDRWALRANPSSGNLHPVEAWVISQGVPGLVDGVHHYRPERHALSLRAADPFSNSARPPRIAVAISSVMWREAWKYGERAFRYCQLDVGHALGTLRYAAAVLGWTLEAQRHIGHDTLAARLGLDREADYPARRDASTEREEAEVLLSVGCGAPAVAADAVQMRTAADSAQWHGTASTIDPYPMYRWPVIGEVARQTRRADTLPARLEPVARSVDAPVPSTAPRATDLILQRRSAQRFDAAHVMPLADCKALLAALDANRRVPFDVLADQARVDLILMIHRVDGVAPGVYLLDRHADSPLPKAMARAFPAAAMLDPVPGLPLTPLHLTEPAALKRLTRSLHCHQDIAACSCLTLGMVAPLDAALAEDPAAYRDLHRAAGLIGQALYLSAESIGLRGTGIGCYFDDPVRETFGMTEGGLRTLYHFTVGLPLDDARIETTPAYADLTLPTPAVENRS